MMLDAIDYSTFNSKEDKDILGEDYRSRALKLKETLDREGIVCNQAHAPLDVSYTDTLDVSSRNYGRLIRSIEVAAILGAENIVVHTVRKGMPKEVDLKEYNKKYYRGLIPYCEKFNICVSVENLFFRSEYDRDQIAPLFKSPQEHIEFVKDINSPRINACFDIGHCSLTGFNPAEWIRGMDSSVLKTLHVHDNDFTTNDFHRLPYGGSIEWDEVCLALAEIGYGGDLTYETSGFLRKQDNRLLEIALKFAEQTGRLLIDKINNNRSNI